MNDRRVVASVRLMPTSLRVAREVLHHVEPARVPRMRAHGAELIGEMRYEDTYRLA